MRFKQKDRIGADGRPTGSGREHGIRARIFIGLALFAALVGIVGGWAARAELSRAVIAPGVLVVDSHVKKIQHRTGGIVGEIYFRDGDQVQAGDVVLRLDDTITRANHRLVTKALTELATRKARLEAERDGADEVVVPAELASRMNDPQVAHVVAGERRLFSLRQAARVGQKAQLRQRIEQLNQEIDGLRAQSKAKTREIELIHRELKGARELWDKQLMSVTKMTSLEREATRVEGEAAQLTSTIARTKARISETELQIIQIDRDLASQVATELRDIDAKTGEYVERKVAAEDELKRIKILAPQDGTVHQSNAHTLGGVIGPGETIMLIVPKADDLTVEARVSPIDIDQVQVGQTVNLRLSAFNQRTTPVIAGTVSRVSADIMSDEKTGASYYTVRIAMHGEETARQGDVTLVPGMPVECFFVTGKRTALSYLLKPVSDQVARAFREE